MSEISDEDRLIRVLQLHKALKKWVMSLLQSQAIECRETYGNDEKGDILIVRSQDTARVQQIVDELQQQFNLDRNNRRVETLIRTDNPHLEIKTQYLYGKEADILIQQGTVIGIVSAGQISQPARLKLEVAGIAYAEKIPLIAFTDIPPLE